jgi:hypothetical protein
MLNAFICKQERAIFLFELEKHYISTIHTYLMLNILLSRSPFIVIAIPAMLCGILVYFTANEPKRGDYLKTNPKESDSDTALSINKEHDETLQFQKILDLIRTPTVALCYLQGIYMIYLCIFIWTYVHICMYLYIYTHMHMYMFIYIYIYICR